MDLQYCEVRSYGSDPRRRVRRSWAWWRPGWSWWICGGWWVCGKTHETWRTKETQPKSPVRYEARPFCTTPCVWAQRVSYGFVWLKMKKALPSGIGVIFSFFIRSEMTGRGPDGTSGSSSSAAGSFSSSSSLQTRKKVSITPKIVKTSYSVIQRVRIPCHLFPPPLSPCNVDTYCFKKYSLSTYMNIFATER